MKEKNQVVALKKEEGSQKNIALKALPSWSSNDKAELSIVIGQIFDMQKQFGKTTGQLENVINGFCFVLSEYDPKKVFWGLAQYLKEHNDIPTPSDIVKIIDPKPPEWKPDKSYYIKLQQLEKEYGKYALNDDEIDYCRRYEDHMRIELKMSK